MITDQEYEELYLLESAQSVADISYSETVSMAPSMGVPIIQNVDLRHNEQ